MLHKVTCCCVPNQHIDAVLHCPNQSVSSSVITSSHMMGKVAKRKLSFFPLVVNQKVIQT